MAQKDLILQTITLTIPAINLENFIIGYIILSYFIVGLSIRFITQDKDIDNLDKQSIIIPWIFSPVVIPIFLFVYLPFKFLTGL